MQEDIKRDFRGQPLEVGDSVAHTGMGSSGLGEGTILKLNKKMATIDIGDGDSIRRHYEHIVKIEKTTK